VLIAKQTRYEGLNWWYANGQVFILASAKIGAGAKCLGIGKDFDDLASFYLGAAVALRTPNPTFISGTVTAGFSLAGGLFSGKFNFDFRYPNKEPEGVDPRSLKFNLVSKIYPSKVDDAITGYQGIFVTLSRPFGSTFAYRTTDPKNSEHIYTTDIRIPKEPSIQFSSHKLTSSDFKFINNINTPNSIAIIPKNVMAPGQYTAVVRLELDNGSFEETTISFTVKEEDNQFL
jgi:hypothetical protein